MGTDLQNPQAVQAPPAPEPPPISGGIVAGASGAPTPQPTPKPQPDVSAVPVQDVVKPAKRGGLAGMIDEIADGIAGTKGPGKVYTDGDGNEYIEHPTLSRKQQWIKITGEALRGAAAGAAAKPGPGQLGRAAEAGVGAGDKVAQQEHEQDREQSQDVRQANLDRMNQIKLKHDMAAKEFEMGRLKIAGSQADIEFAQHQEDRMGKLVGDGKAFDLGTYKDEADLARVKEQQPDFWKHVYQNNVTAVPVIGEDGQRKGIHLFQTTPGVGNEPEQGQQFHVFTPPAKPGDKPKMVMQTATIPMSPNQAHAYDLAAYGQMQKWQTDQTEQSLKGSEINRNNAEAAKDRADANKQQGGATGYMERPDGSVWIGTEGEAKQAGSPFEAMKPGDMNKDKQAMRQLNDVQLNTSRYTHAAQVYSNPNAPLTFRGKPVSEQNPVREQTFFANLWGTKITSSQDLRLHDNRNLNTLMNKAGYADIEASISAGGHISLPGITAFSQSLSREINSRAYNELSDQAKDLYDGYLRTLSAVPAYVKALTNIGRSNKETLDLELANIKHPGYSPNDILRGQDAFQQNIDRAADGFPRNMVGVPHPADIRRHIEKNGGNPELPDDVMQLIRGGEDRSHAGSE